LTGEERAAELHGLVVEIGFRCLVLGGHAVRYYGLDRRTIDFDFQLAIEPDQWPELARKLAETKRLAEVVEGPTFRPADFRRFIVGRLPDGREERLEFWRANHLLPPFEQAWSRREEGEYGGAVLPFLGLSDLIRSKETERDDDWSDVKILEEILDERALARASDPEGVEAALSGLRSRRGFELASSRGLLADRDRIAVAFARTSHVVTRAFLSPFLQHAAVTDDLLARALAAVPPGSGKHLALVEAARNRYRAAAAAADRADKQLLAQRGSLP
jgi:hypothetical protein